MARLTNSHNLEPVINAAQEWIKSCLIADNSVFSTELLWTPENVAAVRDAFVDHPDEGDDNFSTKLKGQMESASPLAKRLMAEMVWALLLFPSNIKVSTKRQQVGDIWSLSGEVLSNGLPLLSDEVLTGIGSGGPGFNNHRWRELVFLISLGGDLKNRTLGERKTILSEYDAFIEWIDQVPQEGQRQFRHMLRFFCFPDRVERMSSNRERCAVLIGFGVMNGKAATNLSDRQLDDALQKLRAKQEADYPGQILDFYEPPLRGLWKVEEDEAGKTTTVVKIVERVDVQIENLVQGFEGDAEASLLHVNQGMLHRLTVSLLSKRFLIATGLAGSGKTKLAQAFARWITPVHLVSDVFTPGAEIPSANVTYYVKKSDSLSVEFWNAENEKDDTIKVSLPREMISEWADYIEKNSIPQTAQAREIREAVKVTSRFSDQLHSFETHLKSAAFALLKSRPQVAHGSCYTLLPVGADWTGSDNILGYADGLQAANYVAKSALDLILHAMGHADTPHFLILDEMNLSHVERYFADILSIIESDEGLELYSGDMERPETWRQTAAKRVPPRLKQLPQNLFIIGTVNVDETTYMFSPKVLDRANVIEFRMDAGELVGFLNNPAKPDLSKLDGKGASFGKAFVDAAKNPVAVPADVKSAYDEEMLLLFKTLQAHGAEFGYRTAYETARFIHFYKLLGNHPDGDTAWFPGAFDCVVFQKLLPKLHGSRAKLGPVLKKLWFLCVNDAAGRGADALKAAEEAARSTDKKAEPAVDVPDGAPYPLSAEKIGRMWRLLIENGFASFAEA
jgi:hypothetical protein